MRSLALLCVLLFPTVASAGTVRGAVLLSNGSAGEAVRIPDGVVAQAELRSQVADPRYADVRNGEFVFDDVAEGGGYEVWVAPPEGLDSYPTQNICVTTGVTEIWVRLDTHGYDERICVPCRSSLTGVLWLAEGVPAKGLPVQLLVGGKELSRTHTDRDGIFRFKDVPELVDVTIEVSRKGFPLYRKTFHRGASTSAPKRHKFTLSDCKLPDSQPN